MSSHNQNKNKTASPGFVSIVLVLTFVITLVIISFGDFPNLVIEADDENSVAVAEAVTDVPLPTETDIPPTATIEPTAIPTNTPTAMPTATIEPTLEPTQESASIDDTATSEDVNYDPAMIAQGQNLFLSCGACHGPEGGGIPNLGKPLVGSEFVDSLTDEELVDFIKVGRPIWDPLNTTGIDMPAKGGNPVLTDDDILSIVAYIRSLDASANTNTEPEQQTTDTVEEEIASQYDAAMIAQGQNLFLSCGACHGPEGGGIPNLGKPLVGSEFVDSLTDEELVDFIKVGRPIWDPLNTTGIDMPAKGGNPVLTDDDILSIVAYIRSLNQ